MIIETDEIEILQRIAMTTPTSEIIAMTTPTSEIGRVVAHDAILMAICKLEKARPQDAAALLIMDELLTSLKEPRPKREPGETPTSREEYALQICWPGDKDDPDRFVFLMDHKIDRGTSTPQIFAVLSDAVLAAEIWKPGSTRIMRRTVSTSDWEVQ